MVNTTAWPIEFYVTAWKPGNGAAFEAGVTDYFQAVNLFNAACLAYPEVRMVRAADNTVERSYTNS